MDFYTKVAAENKDERIDFIKVREKKCGKAVICDQIVRKT